MSSITPTATWNSSPTTSSAASSPTPSKLPNSPPASNIGKGPGSRAAESIEFLTIANQAQSITNDVERTHNHPLVSPSIPIDGYLYDVTSGKLIAIEAATKAGAAK